MRLPCLRHPPHPSPPPDPSAPAFLALPLPRFQIVVEPNGTIIIGPGNGAAISPADVRETAEVEYLTGEWLACTRVDVCVAVQAACAEHLHAGMRARAEGQSWHCL